MFSFESVPTSSANFQRRMAPSPISTRIGPRTSRRMAVIMGDGTIGTDARGGKRARRGGGDGSVPDDEATAGQIVSKRHEGTKGRRTAKGEKLGKPNSRHPERSEGPREVWCAIRASPPPEVPRCARDDEARRRRVALRGFVLPISPRFLRGLSALRTFILFPIRQASLFRWCLAHGLRVVKPMTLMTMGSYQEPTGPFWPSVQY